jgi:Zn-dependent protease with chaperone function
LSFYKYPFFLSSLFFLIFFDCSKCYSSFINDSLFEYRFPDKLPAIDNVDANKLYQLLYKKNAKKFKNPINKRYSEAISFDRKYLTENGFIYLGWDDLESYLNRVLQKILPDSLKNDSLIHVFPSRMTDANACCMGDGSILFNIGMLASIKDEAGIAIILGHELGHYINGDMMNVFLRKSKTHSLLNEMIPEKRNAYILKNLKYSREEEQKADGIGFALAAAAGYDVESGLKNFSIFSVTAKITSLSIIKDTDEDSQSENYSTHPLLEKRIDYLNEFIKTNLLKGKTFLLSPQQFYSLKKKASQECIHLLMERMNYESAIKIAFVNYLYNPEDPANYYFLAENLRRYLYIYKGKSNASFLDYLLPNIGDKDVSQHLYFLYPDKDFVDKAKSNPVFQLRDSMGKLTNMLAYNYFLTKAIGAGFHECYLNAALFFMKDSLKKDSLLRLYLSFRDVKQREFALAFQQNSLYDSSAWTQPVLSFNSYSCRNREFSGEYTEYFISEKMLGEYQQALYKITSSYFPKKKNYSLELSSCSPINYFQLMSVRQTIQLLNYYNIKSPELFILQPEYWYLCRKMQSNTFEFLSLKSWNNHTQIAKSACLYIVMVPVWLIKSTGHIFTGPKKNEFELDYDIIHMGKNMLLQNYKQVVWYRLRKPYFENAVYQTFKQDEKIHPAN